jgi:hypothetical protein
MRTFQNGARLAPSHMPYYPASTITRSPRGLTPPSLSFPSAFNAEYVLQDEWREPDDEARAPAAGGGLLTWARRAINTIASAITPGGGAGEAPCAHTLFPVDSRGRICRPRAGLEFAYAIPEACFTGLNHWQWSPTSSASTHPAPYKPRNTRLSFRPDATTIYRRGNASLKGHRLFCYKIFITIGATTLVRDMR